MDNKNRPVYPCIMQKVGENEYRAARPGDSTLYQFPMEGLTKRELFALNAPDTIPEWFEHKEIEIKVASLPNWYDIKDEKDRNMCKDWVNDPCFELPEHLKWFSDAFDKRSDDMNRSLKIIQEAKYFQWRKYYADALLTELEKPHHE